MAVKAKPPLIPPPHPDASMVSGELIPLIVRNWLAAQPRAKGKAQASKPKPGAKTKKGDGQSTEAIQEPPSLPAYVILTDFPKNCDQVRAFVSSASPPVCWLLIEGAPDDKKGTPAKEVPPDWEGLFQRDIPIIRVAAAAPDENLKDQIPRLADGFRAYQAAFEDARIVDIPSPGRPRAFVPQLLKAAPLAKGAVAKPPEELGTPILDAAFRAAISEFIGADLPTHFVAHALEIDGRLPLSRRLEEALAAQAVQTTHDVLAVRGVAWTRKIAVDSALFVLRRKTLEELVGLDLGDRKYFEVIPKKLFQRVYDGIPTSSIVSMDVVGATFLVHHQPGGSFEESITAPSLTGFGEFARGGFEVVEPPVRERCDVGVGTTRDVFVLRDATTTASQEVYASDAGLRLARLNEPVIGEPHNFVISVGEVQLSCCVRVPAEDEGDVEVTVRGQSGRIGFELELDRFVVTAGSVRMSLGPQSATLAGIPGESHRVALEGRLVSFGDVTTSFGTDGSVVRPNEFVTGKGEVYAKDDGVWVRSGTLLPNEAQFESRQASLYPHGVRFLTSPEENYVQFPGGTRYEDGQWKLDGFPAMKPTSCIANDFSFCVDAEGSTVLKTDALEVVYRPQLRQVTVTFAPLPGQAKKDAIVSLVDFQTGAVANVLPNKGVLWLSEEFQWRYGEHVCSRKELLQLFATGNVADRVKVEALPESARHQPRIFQIGEDDVWELVRESDYKRIAATARPAPDDDPGVTTLWFDTKPPSYRVFRLCPPAAPELCDRVLGGLVAEAEAERNRLALARRLADPKWADAVAERDRLNEEVEALLRQYPDAGGTL